MKQAWESSVDEHSKLLALLQKINENIQVVKNEVNQPRQVLQIQWLLSSWQKSDFQSSSD